MSNKKMITLDVGIQIPQIGLGTFSLSEPGEVKKAVAHALKVGYRHLDMAKVYQNQVEIAEGIEASGVKREEVFLTSKLWNTAHHPSKVAEALNDTLKELKTDYLDLYLIHWPVAFASTAASATGAKEDFFPEAEGGKYAKLDLETSLVDTWKEMIKLKESGKVKAIGVSNFTAEHIDGLIKATGVKPSVNQIERHPLLPQPELIEFCDSHGIHVTAYSPLGNNFTGQMKIVDYPEVMEIAKKLSADPAQVLIAWGTRGGISVIPKSVTPSRIETNFKQIELSDEDYEKVCNLGRGKTVRFYVPKTMDLKWDINVFNTEPEKTAAHEVKIF